MSYDNVIRVLYRGAWHGSKGEFEWSYRFTAAGAEYTLHPKVSHLLHCRPDFRLPTGTLVDYKPNVSEYYGEYKTGNISKLINVSSINKVQLSFVGSIPYSFRDYKDFMEIVKAEAACKASSGFHVFSFYTNGEKADGAYVPMFLHDNTVRFANVDCSYSYLESLNYDIERTLNIYREHPGGDTWVRSVRGEAPELMDLLNKEKFMERDPDLMWHESEGSFTASGDSSVEVISDDGFSYELPF